MRTRTLTPLQEDETPILHELIQGLAEHEGKSSAMTGSIQELHYALFVQKAAHALLLRCQGSVVGSVIYYYSFSTFACKRCLYVEDVFIVPTARGEGHGSYIFGEMARTALRKGCARMEWSVMRRNTGAVALYERLGGQAQRDALPYRVDGETLRQLAAQED